MPHFDKPSRGFPPTRCVENLPSAVRDLRLKVLQLPHQLVELGIADLRLVEDVIQIFVVPDLFAQRLNLFGIFLATSSPKIISGKTMWDSRLVSSSMTSFTQCSGTSFTLRTSVVRAGARSKMTWRVWTFRNNGCVLWWRRSAAKKISGRCARSSISRGPRDIYGAALPGTGAGGHRRAQPASASESGANRRPAGTASGGTAAALSGLGSA